MKPILFNTDMVRAILAGRKTVTRRVVKPQPVNEVGKIATKRFHKPYLPGDILYVRETWQHGFGGTYLYKASAGYDLFMTADGELVSDIPWHPSIHMPREAARIFLRVTDVRVERLQEITPAQIDTEGCKEWAYSAKTGELLPSGPSWFSIAWNSTIKPADRPLYGLDANPWVWVIAFERISREEVKT